MLVERERELGEIARLLSAAAAGTGATVLIEGASGIGKSSLLERARELAAGSGLRVLSARAGELEQDLGFAVVRQLFEPVLSGSGDDPLFAGAARHARGPLGLGEPQGAESEASALHGLYWLCSNLADQGPLLLCVDDLQWADEPSLRFLSYVARRVGDHAVLFCLTSRPEHDVDRSRLRAAVDPEWTHVLRPSRLTESGVAAVVRHVLPGEVAPEFSAACATTTGGNPFLLIEALKVLRDEGIEPTADEAYRLDELRPETIFRTITRRVRRLGPVPVEVSRAVAVLGSDASLRRCATLAGVTPDLAGDAVAALRSEAILAPGTELEFAHPMVRTALYADIDPASAGLAHLHAAELLHAEDAAVERVTAQLLQAEPSGNPWVVERLRAAAADALAHGATQPAAALLERALAEPPGEEDRGAVLLELGTAHAREGSIDAAVASLRRALDLAADVPGRVAAVLELSRALVLGGRNTDATNVLEDALVEFADDESLTFALEFELAAASHLGKPVGEWVARLAQVARRATGPGPGERAIRGLYSYIAASTGNGLDATAVAALARSATSDMPGEDPPALLQVAGAGLAMSGHFNEGLVLIDRGLEMTRQAGDAAQFGFMSLTRSWIASRSGRILESEADAQAGLSSGAQGPPNLAYAVGGLVVALIERHELENADRLLVDHGLADVVTLDALPSASLFYARGRLRLFQGRAADAVRDLETCRAMLVEAGFSAPVFVEWRPTLVRAYLACGDQDAAAAVALEDLTLSRAFGAPRELAMALASCGLVEGGDTGISLLNEAVETAARSESLVELARAQVDLGAALRRTGRRSDAKEPLLAGLDVASACGSLLIADQAQEELLAVGARPRRARTSGPESLTASELRVARLAAAGQSNPEIAQALFVTRRTVEVHLTNAYRKLGIRSRDQLLGALDTVN